MARYLITKTEHFIREVTTEIETNSSPGRALSLGLATLDNPNHDAADVQDFHIKGDDEYKVKLVNEEEVVDEIELVLDSEIDEAELLLEAAQLGLSFENVTIKRNHDDS